MTAQIRKGFTLIELLIVMAILGVLAVVVLVAINPVQQLARTRDAGRKSGVTQMGHALEAYYTARGGTYVAESATWIDDLVTAGELSSAPGLIDYNVSGAAECANLNKQNGWCYDESDGAGLEPAILYVTLESDSEISKCAAGTFPFFVWSTGHGRGGLICSAVEPAVPLAADPWNAIQ